jgi:RNA polymerase sigma-70 factor (ECF subfamily)
MVRVPSLANVFLQGRGLESVPELESALALRLDAAREASPTVHVAPHAFARYLAARVPEGKPPMKALEMLHTNDLYLACACAQRDPLAIAVFDARYLGEVDRALQHMGLAPNVRDDTKQVLRRRFFVEEEGAPPRIVEYTGRGSLRSWVRAAAVRAALRVMRQPKGQVALDSVTLRAVAAPDEDLEITYLKRKYGDDFQRALREAFGLLSPRERNVIRRYFGEGLSIDELGVLYDVHRATAARWVGKAGSALVKKTRELLRRRLGTSPAEISSILRLLHSQLEATLRAVVQSATTKEA